MWLINLFPLSVCGFDGSVTLTMTEDTYYGTNAKSSLVFKTNTQHDAPPYQGIWINKESETVADIIVFGIIKSADVGPYGNQSTAPPNLWNISKIHSAKRHVVIHMPCNAGATLQKTFKEICRGLYELEDDVIDKGAPNSSFVIDDKIISFVWVDGKVPKLHLMFNIWEEQSKQRKTIKKEAIFGDDDDAESAKEEEVKTIYSCPYCDPKGYFENLKDSKKKGFIYRIDCGAYNSEGTTVNVDDLESAFLPGMAVIASINPCLIVPDELRNKKRSKDQYSEDKFTFQLYANTIQSVGLAFKNDFPSSTQLDDTSPSKHRTTPEEFNISPSPKKKPFIMRSPADEESPKKTVPAAVLPVSLTPKHSSSKKGKSQAKETTGSDMDEDNRMDLRL
ncbi:hypothetical protein BS47DRAFT_1490200 [Hydnum rufescens UP504]|uniref:Uncharacterized protein n=1 Tax=Hydnum rufescens UP504 TaxID=1448309 RepID=A0A9P6DMK7_9AGAM|nr:hypothetical protein BS47DRAFT_1490200 [Hydnum rufescens UP504]